MSQASYRSERRKGEREPIPIRPVEMRCIDSNCRWINVDRFRRESFRAIASSPIDEYNFLTEEIELWLLEFSNKVGPEEPVGPSLEERGLY